MQNSTMSCAMIHKYILFSTNNLEISETLEGHQTSLRNGVVMLLI